MVTVKTVTSDCKGEIGGQNADEEFSDKEQEAEPTVTDVKKND